MLPTFQSFLFDQAPSLDSYTIRPLLLIPIELPPLIDPYCTSPLIDPYCTSLKVLPQTLNCTVCPWSVEKVAPWYTAVNQVTMHNVPYAVPCFMNTQCIIHVFTLQGLVITSGFLGGWTLHSSLLSENGVTSHTVSLQISSECSCVNVTIR